MKSGLPKTDGHHQSSDGVVDLEWTPAGGEVFELEHQAPNATPEIRYRGSDTSSVRTGLAEGHHRFRVRAVTDDGTAGPWSSPLELQVSYMDPGKVRLLLILGAIVVTSTVVVILHGHFTHKRESSG